MILPNSIEIQCFVNMLFWPQEKSAHNFQLMFGDEYFGGRLVTLETTPPWKKGSTWFSSFCFWSRDVQVGQSQMFFLPNAVTTLCVGLQPRWSHRGDGLRFTHGIPWQLISWTSRLNNLELCYEGSTIRHFICQDVQNLSERSIGDHEPPKNGSFY